MSGSPTRLGKTSTERLAEESAQAREIVKELTVDLQLSQRQLLLVIHGLALNLEDLAMAQGIASVVREAEGLFLLDRAGGEDGQGSR